MQHSTWLSFGILLASTAAAQAVTVYSTGFEAPAFTPGPLTTAPLFPGQDGWSIDDNTVSATVVSGSAAAGTTFAGTQALQIVATPPSTSYTFRSTPAVPAVDGQVVTAAFAMKILDGSTRSSTWGGTAFDASIATIVGQALVAANGAIVAQNGFEGFPVSAAGLVSRGVWHTYALRFNYANGTYRVLLDGAPVTFSLLGQSFVDLALTPGDGVFGELDFQNTTVPNANDGALFDAFSVTASAVPEPTTLAVLSLVSVSLIRRTSRR